MNNEQKQVIRKEIEKHVSEILSDREMSKKDSDMFGIKRLQSIYKKDYLEIQKISSIINIMKYMYKLRSLSRELLF